MGAGAAGLTLALLLAQQNVPVLVLDEADGLDDQPRATHYNYPALHEMRRAGFLDDVTSHPQAFTPNGLTWRRSDGSALAKMDMLPLPAEYQQICLPLNYLTPIILRHLERQPSAEVRWGHHVMSGSVGQDADSAWVKVRSASGEQILKGDYVVGCDGGSSIVRKSLFPGRASFAGHTWDKQLVASTVSVHHFLSYFILFWELSGSPDPPPPSLPFFFHLDFPVAPPSCDPWPILAYAT